MGSSTDLDAVVKKIVSGSAGKRTPFAFLFIYGLMNDPLSIADSKHGMIQ
jgi:hypothetical protein